MFCGGVGGARAALALYENLPSADLTFLVNTGDDFQHLGLEIWPDWDTVVYHLAGIQESSRGWGRADEGTRVMEELKRFSAPDWFHLGDRDIALHLYRTWALNSGRYRDEICRSILGGFGVECSVLPVMEGSSLTKLLLVDGSVMDFQEWFVGQQGVPEVRSVVTDTAKDLPLTSGVEEALNSAEIVVFAPSNPYLSLGPILNNPRVTAILEKTTVPKLAISPLIGGKAVKGPLDRLIASMSKTSGQQAIADYWEGVADALLLPPDEINAISTAGLTPVACPTRLQTPEERRLFSDRLVEIGAGFP